MPVLKRSLFDVLQYLLVAGDVGTWHVLSLKNRLENFSLEYRASTFESLE